MRLLLILAMSSLAMACAHATSPVQAVPDEIELVGELEEKPQPPAKIPEQPAALVAAMKKLQTGSLDTQVKALVEKARQDMVFVKGGEFLMGDFGTLHSVEKLPYTAQPYNKPLHKVVLDSFSISKYKTTYAEYDIYTKANGLPLIAQSGGDLKFRKPDVPAGVLWQEAKNYCVWLGKVSKLPLDLPTEAQWEYAARARGQFLVFPTNDGYLREGENVASAAQLKKMIGAYAGNHPIGLYPPNPIGLYDLAQNGMEWIGDWFSEDYYGNSPVSNPQGPKSGTEKVLRGWPNAESDAGMSMDRRAELPDLSNRKARRSYNFRCALQRPKPIH